MNGGITLKEKKTPSEWAEKIRELWLNFEHWLWLNGGIIFVILYLLFFLAGPFIFSDAYNDPGDISGSYYPEDD